MTLYEISAWLCLNGLASDLTLIHKLVHSSITFWRLAVITIHASAIHSISSLIHIRFKRFLYYTGTCKSFVDHIIRGDTTCDLISPSYITQYVFVSVCLRKVYRKSRIKKPFTFAIFLKPWQNISHIYFVISA